MSVHPLSSASRMGYLLRCHSGGVVGGVGCSGVYMCVPRVYSVVFILFFLSYIYPRPECFFLFFFIFFIFLCVCREFFLSFFATIGTPHHSGRTPFFGPFWGTPCFWCFLGFLVFFGFFGVFMIFLFLFFLSFIFFLWCEYIFLFFLWWSHIFFLW
jgi:hypothetical protein